MSERRDFLKAAAVQLGVLAGPNMSMASTPSSQDPPSQDPTLPPIPQPSLEEKLFPQYKLTGAPDPETNLLGAERPQDWNATKVALMKALSTEADDEDPIHEWLKVFEEGFVDRVASMLIQAGSRVTNPHQPSGLRYEPQLYDALLRNASMLLDRCLRYRAQLGSLEVTGISAGLAYLAFLKLKPIQRNFLELSNSADLSAADQATEEFVSQRYKRQHGVDRLFEKHVLEAKAAEAEGAAVSAGLAKRKEDKLTHLLEKQFNLQADAQLAQFTRMVTPGNSSNFAERYLRSLVLLAEDLSDAYSMLFSVSKGVQQVLGLSTLTVAVNHSVKTDIPLFTSTSDVTKWVNAVVPVPDIGRRQPDALDALVLWSRAVTRDLDERSQSETALTLSIPLSQPWGTKNVVLVDNIAIAEAFAGKAGTAPTGFVTFTLTSDCLSLASSCKNIRVMGVGVTIEASSDSASPVQYATGFPQVQLPPIPAGPNPLITKVPAHQYDFVNNFELAKTARLTARITSPAQTAQDGTKYSRPSIVMSNIRIQGGSGGDSEPVLSYDPPVRGLSPLGPWSISFDPNVVAYYQSANSINDSWVQGLILHLQVRLTNG